MSPEESLKICRLAKALSPAQALDEFTPEAWALVLRSHRYIDAEEALIELGAEQEWVHVSHIVARIKRIRGQRIRDFGVLPDPPEDVRAAIESGNDAAYADWYGNLLHRIADGSLTATPPLPIVEGHRERLGALVQAATPKGLDDA